MTAPEAMFPYEVAATFAVNSETVLRWGTSGLLDCKRSGQGHRRYLKSAVAAFFPGELIVPVMTAEQAAETLGVSRLNVKWLAESGQVDAIRTPGGHRRFIKSSVESYAVEHASGGAQ